MLLFNENAISSGLGYTIENSLRFRSSASAYLNRTFVTGNRKTWTWSGWVKRGTLGSDGFIFASFGPGGFGIGADIVFVGDTLRFIFDYNSGSRWRLDTTPVYRDPSSWYHFVVCADTTNATSTDRLRIYVNGVRVTNFSTVNYPTLNADGTMNQAYAHNIGQQSGGSYFDGYMAEVNFIDGQALTPASFGEISTSTNSWTAKEYTGTYGTNGFYLPFTDTTSTTTLVADSSGNGNDWTPNNISLTAGVTYDSMIDSPTNGISGTQPVGNYAVLNPLDRASFTVSDGNLKATATSATWHAVRSTISYLPGSWYTEIISVVGTGNGNSFIGITRPNDALSTMSGANHIGTSSTAWAYSNNGNIYNNNAVDTATGTTWSATDIIGVSFDGTSVKFYKNNVLIFTKTGLIGDYVLTIGTYSSDAVAFNFGQRPFTYTPPTGFKSLNTANLPEPTIKKSSEYMDVTTWTGTGATQSIVNSGEMQPDFVWIKSRNNAGSHHLYDALRGTSLAMFSDASSADSSRPNSFTSFNINGFTLGSSSDGNTNLSTYTYVGWQWKEGTTPGFDIVTATTNPSGVITSASHGLGVSPSMIIFKARTGTDSWYVYHKNSTANATQGSLLLDATTTVNTTGGTSGGIDKWTISSTTFGAGNASWYYQASTDHIAYLFAEVPGFSKFGSYTGNGSADGPFVFCGFRPRFVMIKKVSDTGSWELLDTSRSLYNDTRASLLANSSAAETDGAGGNWGFDILSNGFKIRGINSEINTSGGTYIFAAFAETPFKYSLAR